MVIGKPISVEGKSAAELTKEVRSWTEAQSLRTLKT